MNKIELLIEAYKAARESPDPSTQNGAVIVDKYGNTVSACNTFPNGVAHTEDRLVRPKKYNYVEHAERNCIFTAAKQQLLLYDAVMIVPWFACSDCARAIIQVGIRKIIGHQRMLDATPPHWKDSIADAFIMFKEAGIELELIQDKLNIDPIRFNGELWQP